MYQLLLVDDEPMQLKSMEIIEWEKLNIRKVHTARSGVEALEILERHSIDVVVTDIKMPGMNGLDLINHIKSNYKKTRSIILSGFAEFSYAKKAIEYETVSYLIKPVKDEDLIEAVSEALSKIKLEWEQISSYQNAMKLLKENLPFLRGNLLNQLLQGVDMHEKRLEEKIAVYQIPINIGDVVTMVVVQIEKWFDDSNDGELALYEFALSNVAREILSEQFYYWEGKDQLDYQLFLLKPKKEKQGKDLEKLLEDTMEQLQLSCHKYTDGKVSFVISQPTVFPNELTERYQQSINELRKAPRTDQPFILKVNSEKTCLEMKALNQIYSIPNLFQLLLVGKWEEARIKLTNVLVEMKNRNLETEEHKMEITYCILNDFLHFAHIKGVSISEFIGNDIGPIRESKSFKSIDEVISWSIMVVEKLEVSSLKESNDTHDLLIEKVKKYIHDNIRDVSLQTIAESVNLHPVYLSQLYKQKVGENISDYIQRYRMEIASDLLLSTNLRIYEISNEFGFQNPPYFSKIFKSYYGITPQEYRDKMVNTGK
ncbi:response regulator [Evansella sp. AB-rgal1]|uniref:response regulator transcription factor n=1 Tax=Evansella sp. AB-rgal1 TaxID=3242696 RepID=UPI00359DC45A